MRMNVKLKLLLPILATVILGMAGIQTIVGMKSGSILEARIFDGLATDANTAATQMDEWLKDRVVDLDDWSKNHQYSDALLGVPEAVTEANTLLANKAADYPYLSGINLMGADGVVISSAYASRYGLDLSTREYFQKAMAGETSISNPLISKATNKPIFTITVPVRDAEGAILGALSSVCKLDVTTDRFTGDIKVGETGYGFITDAKGLMIAHPNKDFVMELDLSGTDFGKVMLQEKNGTHKYYFDKQDVWKGMGFYEVGQTGWIVATTAPLNELTAEMDALTNYSIFGTLITVLLVALVILFFVTKIVNIIGAASGIMDSLSKGDVSEDVAPTMLAMNDELGDLSKSCQSLIEGQRTRADVTRSIADGDLTVDVVSASEKDLLGNALHEMSKSLNEVMRGVSDAAEQVAVGSGEVSSSSQSLSQGATEQAASIQEITSSMAELGSQTRTNAENANEANSLAEAAKTAASEGNEKMAHMTQAMDDISESSQAIAKIIKVIDEIAFQTNLLALNAAVEAARAGRHGKGFAVVAEEVRNLAGRSAKAAEETTQLIESSISRVSLGSTAAQDTAAVLERITEEAAKVADLLAIIARASTDQANGISEVGEGLDQIDQVTQTNTANAEETASAAEELSAQAETLRKLISRFRIRGVESVTGNLRVQHAAPQALPQASAPRQAPQQAAPDAGSWGSSPAVSPDEIISLDDDEFGKY